MSMVTLKLPYTTNNSSEILKYIKNYSNLLKFTYNRMLDYKKAHGDTPSTKDTTAMQKNMNNLFLDSWFNASAIYDAKGLLSKGGKVIFGGKANFLKRCQKKMTSDEWKELAVMPICSIGEADKIGNRKFRIISENKILFQPNSKNKFELTLPNLRKVWKRKVQILQALQNAKKIAITYKLDRSFIYISYENNLVEEAIHCEKVKDRIFAIDMNPEYVGWSVVDWIDSENHKTIDSGVISNKKINDWDDSYNGRGISKEDPRRKHVTNKRRHENIDTAAKLVTLAIHYGCEIFAIEELKFSNTQSKKVRAFNRRCRNQWCRDIFVSQLRKKCELANIYFNEVIPSYSSFVGNLAYRDEGLPDMCLASIEIGRRGYEFYHQYIIKDKQKTKNIVFDNSKKTVEAIAVSLEELGVEEEFEKDIRSMFLITKTQKLRYRVPIEESKLKSVSSKKSTKSRVVLYSLI